MQLSKYDMKMSTKDQLSFKIIYLIYSVNKKGLVHGMVKTAKSLTTDTVTTNTAWFLHVVQLCQGLTKFWPAQLDVTHRLGTRPYMLESDSSSLLFPLLGEWEELLFSLVTFMPCTPGHASAHGISRDSKLKAQHCTHKEAQVVVRCPQMIYHHSLISGLLSHTRGKRSDFLSI